MQFAQIYTQLSHSTNSILALLNGVSQAEAQVRPSEEAWSILEVACHLLDEEREDFRVRIDYVLHRPGQPWPRIDPQGWVSSRHYNQQDLAATIQQWTEERAKSLEWLNGLRDADWDKSEMAPWGSPLHAGDLLCAWAAHDNLHLRQLVELRRAMLERMAPPYSLQYAGDW